MKLGILRSIQPYWWWRFIDLKKVSFSTSVEYYTRKYPENILKKIVLRKWLLEEKKKANCLEIIFLKLIEYLRYGCNTNVNTMKNVFLSKLPHFDSEIAYYEGKRRKIIYLSTISRCIQQIFFWANIVTTFQSIFLTWF